MESGEGGCVAEELDVGVEKSFGNFWPDGGEEAAMDDGGFGRVACGWVIRLCSGVS